MQDQVWYSEIKYQSSI